MKKKLAILLIISGMCAFLTGCDNEKDCIEIFNKNGLIFDNIQIEIKEGYFYENHEKFVVDDNTVAVTVYFSNTENSWEDVEDSWE